MKALKTAQSLVKPLLSRKAWISFGNYVGVGKSGRTRSITNQQNLSEFINSRASHVAQTTLYGYLRTRAGTRFPELFENPDILTSINYAKWHVWAACVSDLSIFIGILACQSGIDENRVRQLINAALNQVLEDTGTPDEAGEEFQVSLDKARQRIANFNFAEMPSDDDIFSQSPEALYYWSPIAEELKERDENIVRNSMRFRWIEVRRSCRKLIQIEALFTLPVPTS